MDRNEEELSWSIPKILVGFLVIGILGWFIYQNREFILSYNNSPKEVAGAKTEPAKNAAKVALPEFDLQEKITSIAQEVANLDVKDVSSSSPQVQKVLRDMEALKDLPKSQAKDACMKLCSGL